MIPETSRELHLNPCDQSRLASGLSHTCLTALNTPCVHKACVCGDRRYTSAHHHHHHLTLSPPEWPCSTAAHINSILASSASPHWLAHTFIRQSAAEKTLWSALVFQTFYSPFMHQCQWQIHVQMVEFVIPKVLMSFFLPHMVAILIPGCLRIFRDTTSTAFT